MVQLYEWDPPYKECDKKMTFAFDYNNPKYKKYMHWNLKTFLNKLEDMAKESMIYDKYYGVPKKIRIQLDINDQLIKKFKEYNLEHLFEETHASPIECYINNYAIQCKTTNVKVSNTR